MPNLKPASWLKIIGLLILLIGAAFAWRNLSRDQLLNLIQRAQNLGWPGYLGFILGYSLWCAVGLPPAVLSLGAAAAFGFWRGLTVVLIAANLGAFLGFSISRHFARDWFTKIVGKRLPLAQFNRAVVESGWRIVMLTRLPPISPFTIVNYAYGLTPVALRDYMIGTAIGIIPGTTAYIYLGTLIGDVAQAENRAKTPLEWSIYVCGFIVTVAICIYIIRLAKAALARHAIEE